MVTDIGIGIGLGFIVLESEYWLYHINNFFKAVF